MILNRPGSLETKPISNANKWYVLLWPRKKLKLILSAYRSNLNINQNIVQTASNIKIMQLVQKFAWQILWLLMLEGKMEVLSILRNGKNTIIKILT